VKLINDRQFRISLCTALVHDAGSRHFSAHTRHCLAFFATIARSVPADVAAAHIEKLFGVLPLDDADVSTSFSDLLGAVAGGGVVLPLVKTWSTSRSFAVGRISLSPAFVAATLAAVAKDTPVAALGQCCCVELLVRLTKVRDVPTGPVLAVLAELCERLSFQKGAPQLFDDRPFECFLKFTLDLLSSSRTKHAIWQCLNALRLLVQSPPCLSPSQFGLVADKLLAPGFLSAAAADAWLAAEFRGVVLAVVCVLPQVGIVVSLLRAFVPFLEHGEVISIVWRMLSIFEAHGRDSASPIKFFRPVETGRVAGLPRFLAELLAASQSSGILAVQSAALLLAIDRGAALVPDVVAALTDDEFRALCTCALDSLSRDRSPSRHTSVLAECLRRDGRSLSPAALSAVVADVLSGRFAAADAFVRAAALAAPALFCEAALCADAPDVVARAAAPLECAEALLQHCCAAVLAVPPDGRAARLFGLVHAILRRREGLPPPLLAQVAVALLVFGFAARAIGDAREIRQFEIADRLVSSGGCAGFAAVWAAVAATVAPGGDVGAVIAALVDAGTAGEAISYAMSTAVLTQEAVSSAFALLYGRVLDSIGERDLPELFNLAFSGLLSLGSVSDVLTCVCVLNEVTRFVRRTANGAPALPEEFVFRILRVLQKGSTARENEARVCTCLCLEELARHCAHDWSDDIHAGLFAVVFALMKAGQFEGSANVLTVLDGLTQCGVKSHYARNYALLYRIVAFHSDVTVATAARKVDVEDFDGFVGVIRKCFEAAVPWMEGAALRLLLAEQKCLLGRFRETVVDLIGHEDDTVTEAAQAAFAVIFAAEPIEVT
jgi:hypothetical protein